MLLAVAAYLAPQVNGHINDILRGQRPVLFQRRAAIVIGLIRLKVQLAIQSWGIAGQGHGL